MMQLMQLMQLMQVIHEQFRISPCRVVIWGLLLTTSIWPGLLHADDEAPWAPPLASRQDDVDSPYVPAGYHRAFTANFLDPDEVFNPTDNPRFTTGHFRLHGDNDLNVTRRLGDNRELQLYVDGDFTYAGQPLGIDPYSVRDGVLHISATQLSDEHRALLAPLGRGKKLPAPKYASGLLSTETQGRDGKGHLQSRGYWELRAQLPAGRGLWPAFWLVTHTHDYWDEVDIFEVLGHEPDAIYHTTHFHDGGGTAGVKWEKRITRGIDTSARFHVFGMLITDDDLVYSIDGVERLRVKHTLESPLYTIVNLAVGGTWPKNPDQTTPFPAVMKIDYLRIYAPGESSDATAQKIDSSNGVIITLNRCCHDAPIFMLCGWPEGP